MRLLRASRRAGIAGALVLAMQFASTAAIADRGAPPAVTRHECIQVWVDLCRSPLPPRGGAASAPSAEALRELSRRQDELMQRMQALGAVEIARVRIVRQAIAVDVPVRQLDALRALDGVCGVSPIRHPERPPPDPVR